MFDEKRGVAALLIKHSGFYFIAVRKLLQHMGGAARRAAPPMCCT